MLKEGKKTPTDNVSTNDEFVENLLKSLIWVEPKRLIEVRAFFNEAFLLLTDDEIFNESEYRQEWANNIYVISELCKPLEKYSSEELKIIINNTLENLKKEKEVRNA